MYTKATMSLNFGSFTTEDLHTLGLVVAVHNDYRLQGKRMTFWLMTLPQGEDLPDLAFKGEGESNAEALDQIRTKYQAFVQRLPSHEK